jgi:glycosyltransferase involved in cell wall biosynthesis
LRVLQVADLYPPEFRGGLEMHVERLVRHLIAAGHDVAVVTGARESELRRDGDVAVYESRISLAALPGRAYLPGNPPYHPPWPDPLFSTTLRAAIQEFAPDVIHAHGWSAFSAAALPSSIRVPVVATLHDFGLVCPKKSLLRHGGVCRFGLGTRCVTCDSHDQSALKRTSLAIGLALNRLWLRRRVARFIAVSEYVRDAHVRNGLGRDGVSVIPNFIDLPAHSHSSKSPAAKCVLYAGPSDYHKGRQVLLDAYRRIRDPAFALLLAGASIDSSVLSDGVVGLGWLGGDALAETYRRADVAVVPSIWPDPCPTVALDALAHGCPLIASSVGGLTELVGETGCGVLVPPSDSEALAHALETLLSDEKRIQAMSRVARARAVDYSAATVVPRISAEYQKALDRV